MTTNPIGGATERGRPAPSKPWERPGTQSASNGGSPFAPSTSNRTAESVNRSDLTSLEGKNGETRAVRAVTLANGRQLPLRPWERSNTGHGSAVTTYNRPYGGLGHSSYGGTSGSGSGYGSMGSSYGSNYGGMQGGSPYGGYGGYSGSLHNSFGGYGGTGSYNMGSMTPYGGGYGPRDLNFPEGGPPLGPPTFWESVLRVLHGVVNFFGRISILVDENTQAFHFFITALLQLCDRAGVLYGELARFVLRLLGFRMRSKAQAKAKGGALTEAGTKADGMLKEGNGAWDNLWSDNSSGK